MTSVLTHPVFIMFVVMLLLMFLGMEIFASMGVASVVYLLISGQAPLTLLPNNMINGISNFALLAIPFFMLVGDLMNISGMTARLVDFAKFFVGSCRGGLAYISVIVTTVTACVSGSAPATCSAVSAVMLPATKKEDYPMDFSAAVICSSSVLGAIIPPSVTMVFIALITNLSVGRLFFGGLVPGFLMSAVLLLVCKFQIRKYDFKVYPTGKKTLRGFFTVLKSSILALMAPFIILYGVFSGLATITEVSILACTYVLFVGMFVYRSIGIKDVFAAFFKTSVFSSTIMANFSVARMFAWFIAVEGLGRIIGESVIAWNLPVWAFMLFINVLFIVTGFFMDAIPIMVIFVPVLMPVVNTLGIDPIYFCVVVVINLMIGLLTPPVGGLLFLQSMLADVPFNKLVAQVTPFVIALFCVLFLVTYVPQLILFVPNLLFG